MMPRSNETNDPSVCIMHWYRLFIELKQN